MLNLSHDDMAKGDPREDWKKAAGRRLRGELNRLDLSQADVARRLRCTKQLINHWLTGRSELMTWDLRRLAQIGVDIDQVMLGEGAGSGLKIRLPTKVISFCTLRELIDIASDELDQDDVDSKRVTYANCSARALSFEIPPDYRSMEPRLKPGMITTFDREKLPVAGDIVVVVLLAGQELLIGRYRPAGKAGNSMSGPFSLLFDNDKFFEPRAITTKDRPVFMGTLVEDTNSASR